jgi:hypothetical protein
MDGEREPYFDQRMLPFPWRNSKLINHDGPVSVDVALADVR